MSVPLDECIKEAKNLLNTIELTLKEKDSKIPHNIPEEIHDLVNVSAQKRIERLLEVLKSRDLTISVLEQLENKTDSVTNRANVLGTEIDFNSARFIFIQSYISTMWAISDTITEFAGRILCIESVNKRNQGAKLLQNFIRNGKSTVFSIDKFFKEKYGLPIGVSYVIRNLFIHGCGFDESWVFFEGQHCSTGFRISDKALKYIEDQLDSNTYPNDNFDNVKSYTNASEPWPWPQDDLRKLLKICHREMDDALGVLLLTACNLLKTLVASLIE